MSEHHSEIMSKFETLRSDFESLHDESPLRDLMPEINEITRKAADLPEQIAKIRSRGYDFASYLEQKIEVMRKRWEALRHETQRSIERETAQLRDEVERLKVGINQAQSMRGNPQMMARQVPELEKDLSTLVSAYEAAKQRVKALYTTLSQDLNQTITQMEEIHWYLDQRDEASFKFLSGEGVFLVAKAEWQASGKGRQDPDGMLYLTDQRLIFEQKETTGKTLGLFGGKKTQELEWEIPLSQIEGITAENKGLFGMKDLLHFTFKAGAPFPKATVEVKGNAQCKFWVAQIERMTSGDVKDERAVQPDTETLAAIRAAPTACPSCTGTLPQVGANEQQVVCAYCGAVIKL